MTTATAHPGRDSSEPALAAPRRLALLGNPNTGKTTLFNRLTGLRHKTANFPGTTLEARLGLVNVERRLALPAGECCGQEAREDSPATGGELEIIDLPGIYSLELLQPESEVCRDVVEGRGRLPGQAPGENLGLCVVMDATNLSRNLRLAGEGLRRRLPTVVAVNMIDLARRVGLRIDAGVLAQRLGCEVVLCSARTGEGLDHLRGALARARVASRTPPGGTAEDDSALTAWADDAFAAAASGSEDVRIGLTFTDRLDRVVTHPVAGLLVFLAVMGGLFYAIFSLARVPMDLISAAFAVLSAKVHDALPPGFVRDLLSGGVLSGVSAILVFLPQICLLFFLISLLEDTGYLARGAFIMDRMLRPFGLAGHSFVPLLSSHACALPGIMACRGVPDPRERLATILVAPFMSCSARLPVYALLTSVLFPARPALAALAFVGCYALGLAAGVLSALVARRTILRGASRPMALELPTYKWPSLRTAAITTIDRALVFIKNAGTNILAICVVLWWLGSFPRLEPPARIETLRHEAALVRGAQPERAAGLALEADGLEREHTRALKRQSFMGSIGRAVQPVLAPLGYDWQLSVGVLASFAAREVFASTMAVVITGEEDAGHEGVLDQIAGARRDDGRSPVFTAPVAWSLLVYYVLAMQCLPTLVVTARESGGVRWAVLQLAWMSGLAYLAALAVFQITSRMGW